MSAKQMPSPEPTAPTLRDLIDRRRVVTSAISLIEDTYHGLGAMTKHDGLSYRELLNELNQLGAEIKRRREIER